MTLSVDSPRPRGDAAPTTPPRGAGPRRRARWMPALVVLVLAFLAFVLPPYLGLDPSAARIPVDASVPWHYPVLIVHIATSTIALLTLCLQMWPWLREHHPAVHRVSGRVYVFAGALPAALLSLVLCLQATSPIGTLGVATAGAFWAVTTAMGWIRGRQRRWGSHRRWMLYSFAFALQATWARLIAVVAIVGGLEVDPVLMGEAGTWLGWIVNVLLVHWWIERTRSGG
ncbi:DUF2306 domain-containing protein [Actinomycetospora aeridis]|uniref:DUF2306 domain-containing protein n=1 Tax=Actinomycetospora aeridis TaxID=3129231 RepID=A0ABU8N2D3_9PSEU